MYSAFLYNRLDIMETIYKWMMNIHGKSIDIDGMFGPQSPDLIKHYLKEVFGCKYEKLGNGKDIAKNISEKYGWEMMEEGFTLGDILSFDWDEYGHCAVVMCDWGGDMIGCFHQNGYGGGAEMVLLPRNRVVGAVRVPDLTS